MAKLTKEERLELLRRKENCEALLKARMACKEHVYPTTRRQFLEAGLLGFAASITLPSFLPSLLSQAHAQSAANCSSGDGKSEVLPGFLTVALTGGAGLMGTVQYYEQDGTALPSYRKHGVGANPETESLMGATFYSNSSFVTGLKAVLGENTGVLNNTQLIAVPCDNQDDTNTNEQDISGLILQLGKSGQFFQNTGTNNNSPGKLFHQPVMVPPPVALGVTRLQDLRNASQLSGQLGNLSDSQRSRLAKFVGRLSEAQSRRLAMETRNGNELKKVVDCATQENIPLIENGVPGLNPTEDPALRSIWNIATGDAGARFNSGSGNADATGNRVVTAALVQATLTGTAGPVGVHLGGYDYHSGTNRNTANQRDEVFGRMIARVLLHAQNANKKMAIYVCTDGSVSTPESDNSDTANWSGDSRTRGSFWLILFDPAGRPALADSPTGGQSWQIGGFTPNQTVNKDFFTGGSSSLAAGALAVNYGLFAGKSVEVSRLFNGRYTAEQLSQIARVKG